MISLEDQEEIEALTTTRKKSDKIIDILLMRGPKAYDHFCDAILDLNVEAFIVTKLNTRLGSKIEQAISKLFYFDIRFKYNHNFMTVFSSVKCLVLYE